MNMEFDSNWQERYKDMVSTPKKALQPYSLRAEGLYRHRLR